MIARNCTQADLEAALKTANKSYKGNLQWNRQPEKRGKGFAFTLRVARSDKPGHRRGHTGRRMVSACWHAHRDFMRALFAVCPDASLNSAMASYNGRNGFERSFEETGDRNIGSMMQPLYARHACDCGTTDGE